MKYLFLLLFIPFANNAQTFLNGDFELTTATENQINISNYLFTKQMLHTTAFGNRGNMDIIETKKYCGLAQSGNWFVAIVAEDADIISMELSTPLIAGNEYTITFHDRGCERYGLLAYAKIGVSDTIDRFGTLVYQASDCLEKTWTRRTFKFIAPTTSKFITVKGGATDSTLGSISYWIQVDNFFFGCPDQLDLGKDTTICEHRNIDIGLNTADATYLWENGSTDSIRTITEAGTYIVEITHPFCGTLKDTIDIDYTIFPPSPFPRDTTICLGDTLFFDASMPNATYQWHDLSTSPTYSITESGKHWVKRTINHCYWVSVLEIEHKDCLPLLEMPNTFTPNGDGYNELFYARKIERIPEATLYIFNRWGQKLFETSDLTQGWDGTFNGQNCVEGTYSWAVSYLDIYGKGHNDKGFLTLIR